MNERYKEHQLDGRYKKYVEKSLERFLILKYGSDSISILGRYAISQRTIEKIWKRLYEKLRQMGYRMQNIKIPNIYAIVLGPRNFIKFIQRLRKIGFISMDIEEYGRDMGIRDTGAICLPRGKAWVIIIQTYAERGPLERYLIHEILHIFEDLLGLRWGSLTRFADSILKR